MRPNRPIAWIATGIVVCASTIPGFSQESPPARSTTGPIPPPSVAPKKQMRLAPDATSYTIAGVPEYLWRHGCGPTAVGMVIGYYDTHGYGDLFDGDGSTQVTGVNQGIASQGSGVRGSGVQKHYEDYSLPNDNGQASVIPDSSVTYPTNCHLDDCIADFMHTSWSIDGNFYGWSWSNRISPSFTSYVALRNSNYGKSCAQYNMGATLTWSLLTSEINANRPMVFLVDSDGNGATDHFVTVVAYSDSPTQQYGCLDTWAPAGDIRWCQFRSMSSSYSWGVWGGWTFLLQPAKVTNPSPSHGATNQPPTTTLSWSNGGGATSYDVYFGTNPTPGTSQFRGNQTGTSYNPGGLLDNTTYYWRIDARGAGNGMTTGNVWNFTTGTTQPPSPPTNPSPTDGAIHQPVTVNLGWAAGSGAESYDIYFGTVPEPGPSEFRGNQTATTFSPGTLEYCTIYHWRIDSKNKAGTTTGSVWTFRTKGLFGDFDCDGDIDLTDFGHLQECLTGPGVETIPSECETADYDGDHDVDIVELTRFKNCISGAGIPADPQCEP